MLAATRGEVWLTETGGIVARNNNSRVRLPASTAHAAKATRFVFEKLVRVDPRIKRVYLYHWNDQPRPAHLGLGAGRAPTASARPAYDVLRDRLRRLRISGHLGSVAPRRGRRRRAPTAAPARGSPPVGRT